VRGCPRATDHLRPAGAPHGRRPAPRADRRESVSRPATVAEHDGAVTIDDGHGSDRGAGLSGDAVVEQLRRWEGSGALLRVVDRGEARVVIALLTCSDGNELGRITSSDPEVLAFVADRGGCHPQ
jgi:hypothetical protein